MLRLRPYKSCDAEKIVTWLKDERSFRKWCADCMTYPLTAEGLNAYYQKEENNEDYWTMVAFDESGVVGQFIMKFPDENKKRIRLGFIIVDGHKRGKGYGKEMLELAKKYAYEILKVEEIELGVFENNEAAYRCYQSVGFKEKGERAIYKIFDEEWICLELNQRK
ncbi:MAG: GNAT family N-acetyltransferase [Cellulosilyticum sp.]|nr:GNAT family N-acetyltransferase [Cellulosilyticum sp.]